MDFQTVEKSNFVSGNFFKIRSFINLPWGKKRSHNKFGPDWFSRSKLRGLTFIGNTAGI